MPAIWLARWQPSSSRFAKVQPHVPPLTHVRDCVWHVAGVLDNLYDQAVQEVVRRRDEATDRLEAEADNKTVESVGGTPTIKQRESRQHMIDRRPIGESIRLVTAVVDETNKTGESSEVTLTVVLSSVDAKSF